MPSYSCIFQKCDKPRDTGVTSPLEISSSKNWNPFPASASFHCPHHEAYLRTGPAPTFLILPRPIERSTVKNRVRKKECKRKTRCPLKKGGVDYGFVQRLDFGVRELWAVIRLTNHSDSRPAKRNRLAGRVGRSSATTILPPHRTTATRPRASDRAKRSAGGQ